MTERSRQRKKFWRGEITPENIDGGKEATIGQSEPLSKVSHLEEVRWQLNHKRDVFRVIATKRDKGHKLLVKMLVET